MATGTVKWFNGTKGFGFITPDEGEKDVFLHKTALIEAKIDRVDEGQKIEYDIVKDEEKKKEYAGNIKLIVEEK